MAHVAPLAREDLADFEPALQLVETVMGFVPNSMFTMARVPGLFEGFMAMTQGVLANDLVPGGLKQMVALMTSAGAGCRYCQSHTGHNAHRQGVSEEKLAAIWHFETSELFDEAERAALRLAFHAGQSPNATTDEHWAEMHRHYDADQCAAIVAVISMFGFLNRWNDTMATTLEPAGLAFGERVLASSGWDPGKHA